MTLDTLMPLLTGFFAGGICTEIRWIGRLRRLQRHACDTRAVELAPPEVSITQHGTHSAAPAGLLALHDEVVVEAGRAPEPDLATASKI